MATGTLTGQTIANTYKALLKITGTDAGGTTLAADAVIVIEDGDGNPSSLSLSQQRATITLGSGAGDDFIVDGTTLVVEGDNNRVGIGTAAPDGTLHVHTATAGSITANSISDDLVIENSAGGGLTILTPDANDGRISIGSASDNIGAALIWNYDSGLFTIGSDKVGGQTVFTSNNGNEAMRIDASKNVGIGTTNPEHLLHVEGDNKAIEVHSADYSNIRLGAAGSSGGDLDKGVILIRENGSNKSQITGTGVTYFGGNVGIGTTSPYGTLHVFTETDDTDESTNVALTLGSSASGKMKMYFGINDANNYTYIGSVETAIAYRNLVLQPNGGNLGIGVTPAYKLDILENTDSFGQRIRNSHANAYGLLIDRSAGSGSANTDRKFLTGQDDSQARFIVYADGSVQNVDGTYGSSLSDERLKKDIVPANSQWDDVKNIDIVNYKIATHGDDAKKLMSVVAQQVQKVSPNLIGERPPDKSEIAYDSTFGTLYEDGDELPEGKEIGDVKEEKEKVLFFKDSIFFWKCAKALQESMAKIETLEAKVEALENA